MRQIGRSDTAEGASAMSEHVGYLLEPLRDSAEFTLYRGHEPGDPASVLVVAPAAEQPSPQSRRQLEHECSLAADLDPAWTAWPVEVTRRDGRTMLILEDPGGEPLDWVLERREGQPFELTRVVRIAIGLATALGRVHRQGLIHKDVKPANVLVDDADHVWLTGFGIASRLPRESQAPAPPEIIAGTLAYMAPEQTGRMNRSKDRPENLAHCAVARKPESSCTTRSRLFPVISAIGGGARVTLDDDCDERHRRTQM
jgi:serine/threonine protein kinase